MPFVFLCFLHQLMHTLSMLLFQPSPQDHLMIVSAYSFFLIIFCIAKPRMLQEPFLTRIQAHVARGVAGSVGRHVMIWAGEDYRFG